MNRYLKAFLAVSIIFITIGGYKIIKVNQPLDDQVVHVHNYLSIFYEADNNKDFRYKYELIYTPASDDINETLDQNEPLLVLEANSETVAEIKPSQDYSRTIPVISESFKPSDNLIADEFRIELVSKNKNRDKIKFETKIILEELKGGKWSPVYQVIQMERGPYWSLDKGPVEFIETDIAE